MNPARFLPLPFCSSSPVAIPNRLAARVALHPADCGARERIDAQVKTRRSSTFSSIGGAVRAIRRSNLVPKQARDLESLLLRQGLQLRLLPSEVRRPQSVRPGRLHPNQLPVSIGRSPPSARFLSRFRARPLPTKSALVA